MKESLKKRIESIEKKEGSTEKFMYLCGIIGIVDIVFGILSLYLHFSKMEKKAENGKGSQEDDRKSRLKKKV